MDQKTRSLLKVVEEHAGGLESIAEACHLLSERAGWWYSPEFLVVVPVEEKDYVGTGWIGALEWKETVIPIKLALVHSEVSEALEGYRKNANDDHLPDRPSVEVELADAVIRIFDIAGALDLDLAGALVEKLRYNQTREARAADGGKRF